MTWQDQEDEQAVLKKAARNDLGDHLYRLYDSITSAELRAFVGDGEMTEIIKMLKETEEWLYSEKAQIRATTEAFEERLRELKRREDEIRDRRKELQQRAHYVRELKSSIDLGRRFRRKYVTTANALKHRYNHISEEELDGMVTTCAHGLTFLERYQREFKEYAGPHLEPPIKWEEFKKVYQDVDRVVQAIVKKARTPISEVMRKRDAELESCEDDEKIKRIKIEELDNDDGNTIGEFK